MLRNSACAQAWADGKSGASNRMHTDGKNLYSYALRIGYTDLNGNKVLYDYGKKGFRKSVTTTQHVSVARQYACQVVTPDEMHNSGY